MLKSGQFQIGFGMIFSIILIIAIVAISAYVIINFLQLGRCTEIGLFYDALKNEVDKAWQSTIYSDVFNKGTLPKGIEHVCFGELNIGYSGGEFSEQFEFLSRYKRQDKNVFMYPTQNACDSNMAFYKLEHAEIREFFCSEVIDGKINLKLKKGELDALVKLNKN